jgi:hypothetical protein
MILKIHFPRMKRLISLIISLTLGISIAQGQEIQNAEPHNGLSNLAIHFYSIDLTNEQRAILNDTEIELIFLIDSLGVPILKDINGLSDQNIIDSLKKSIYKIPKFYPKKVNGKSEESIYFLKLSFPSYRMTEEKLQYMQSLSFKKVKLADFEFIEKSNSSIDVVFSGQLNQFIGHPQQHLKTGGGMKIDISYTSTKKYNYGLDMSFYGNTLKLPYILQSNKEQLSGPPSLFVGAFLGKKMNRFNINFEMNLFVQNITQKINDRKEDWVQFKGWSPGFTIHYPIKFGKDIPRFQFGDLTIYNNCINLNFGLKSMIS